MKNQFHISGGELQGALFDGTHLTDDALLLFLEGELAPAQHSVVEAHIWSCWTCLAQRDSIKRAMVDFADFQNAFVAPHLPPSSAGRAVFMARLDELAAEMGSPSRFGSWFRNMGEHFRSLIPTRQAWISIALLAAIGIPLFYFVRKQSTPSPTELLGRAATSEMSFPTGVNQPVIVQKLRIRTEGCNLTRTVYREMGRKRSASRTDGSALEERAVREQFAQSGLNWAYPLSAEQYQKWLDSNAVKEDAVNRVGDDLLRLDTTVSSGSIAEASFTVRAKDFHPVEESIRLRDDSHIEIAELSFQVVGIASLNPDIFGASEPPTSMGLTLAEPKILLPHEVDTDEELAMTEIQVRSALHRLQADLGEQIDVQSTPNNEVLVEGIVADEARRQQLVAALESIPHTQAELETVAQAIARQRSNPQPAALPTVKPKIEGDPLLEARLKQRFPNEERRTAYVNQMLSLAQSASARAWALNRLAERYSPQQIALLDVSSRQSLRDLLGDHIVALQEDINQLQNRLGPVLSSSSDTVSANTAVAVSNANGDDWRNQAHRVHSSVETVEESVTALLTDSSPDDRNSSEDIEIGLRTTLIQLQADLQTLNHQVHKAF